MDSLVKYKTVQFRLLCIGCPEGIQQLMVTGVNKVFVDCQLRTSLISGLINLVALGSPLIDGIFLVQKNVYLFLRYSVYNFIHYARSSSMRGQLVMHQCLPGLPQLKEISFKMTITLGGGVTINCIYYTIF